MGLNRKFTPFFNLNGGLNTETSPLNVPENDLISASNVWIDKNKGIVRRFGVDFIGKKDSDSEVVQALPKNTYPVSHTHRWQPVFNNERRRYLVHVLNDLVKVYDFTIPFELRNYDTPINTTSISGQIQIAPISFADHNNQLFMFGGDLDTTFTHYAKVVINEDGDPVTQPQIMYMRDPESNVVDSVVKNDGKTYGCIKTHVSAAASEPGTGSTWEEFWVVLSHEDTVYAASAWVTATSYVSNVKTLDQAADAYTRRFYGSTAGNPTPAVDNTQIKVGTVAQGRVWIAGPITSETILFSQTLREEKHEQRFYTFNDPNSTVDSSILATDGGDISIAGAGRIVGLQPLRTGVFVLAENGIWAIRGTGRGEGFLPTAFSVDQVWTEGVFGYRGATTMGDSLIFADHAGVWLVRLNDDDEFTVEKITTKVDSKWQDIPTSMKETCQLTYDHVGKKLYILYRNIIPDWMVEPEGLKYPVYQRGNLILIYDFVGNTWTEYEIPAQGVLDEWLPFINEMFVGFGVAMEDAGVITDSGDNVQTSTFDEVVAKASTGTFANDFNVFFVSMQGDFDNQATQVLASFGELAGTNYSDWWERKVGSQDYRRPYTSSFSTAYLLEDTVLHKKEAPYIFLLMERDDDNFGLQMAYDWNWAESTVGANPYYGTLQDVYTGGQFALPDNQEPSVKEHKARMRGFGRALSLRFTNSVGKGFRLYGWQLEIRGDGRMGN
jgi:hypothetical protein